MNNTLENPVGIDEPLERIKDTLYSKLSSMWSGDIDAFGRVYKKRTDNAYKPQWWDKTILEYKDVRYNDDVAATFCFIESEKHNSEDGLVYTSDVKCVFMVNLNRILPDYIERADEKAKVDVVNILRNNLFGMYQMNGSERGVRNVFNGFETVNILDTDIQPKHCFSININLSYYINCS